MKEVKSNTAKNISVKAYAEMIGKSDKTVYKMIKDGLVSAKKGKNGYEVMMDGYVFEEYKNINKELRVLKKSIKILDERLEKLESKSTEKKVLVKKAKAPIKKAVKKTVAKTVTPKKPIKKTVKKSVKVKNTKK